MYSTRTDCIEDKTVVDRLLYERDFLNINQAIRVNIETGEIIPTLIIEYETIEYMKVKLEWIDNMKNGVYSELVTPKNTLKSVLYKLLK